MLKLNKLTKFYPSVMGKQYVFKDLDFDFPVGENVAFLGQNGAGKSTLLRLLAKSEYPSSGKIETDLNISWPVALTTGIHAKMTAQENARFIAKVNGVRDLAAFEKEVQEFSELGDKYYLPVSTYSQGMRSRILFACATAINFDLYLIDEATSVGDPVFRKKARARLLECSERASVIMVSHQMQELRAFCDSAIIVNDGKLTYMKDLEEAITLYEGK